MLTNLAISKPDALTQSFRAVLIGLGAGADRLTLPALTNQPHVRLVAACDVDAATRDQSAQRWNIPRVYEDAIAMLATEKPDITVIATPPMTHYDLTLQALHYGSHVYCEKPFMPSLPEVDQVIQVAHQQQRLIGINSQYYQLPIYQKVQELLKTGEVGRLYHIDAWQQMYLLPHEEGGWKAALQPRRVLFEFGTHAIDLICRYFQAYPQAVTARVAQVRADVDADVCIQVRLDFPERRMANLMFNRMSYAPIRYFEMRLNCEKAALRTSLGGVARLDLGWNSERKKPRLRFSFTKGGEARLEQFGDSKLLVKQSASALGDATTAHFSTFVIALQQGKTVEQVIAHDYEILKVLFACYTSAELQGELVKV